MTDPIIFMAAAVLLTMFCLLGVFDGLYFHLYKYKLHLQPSARKEHLLHTARAFVFVPMALLIFVFNTRGLFLHLGIVLVLADLGLELLDILEEKKSRAPLGGISSEETAIHVFASGFKLAAIVVVLLGKESSAFHLLAPSQLGAPFPGLLSGVGALFSVGCLLGGVVSVLLPYLPSKPMLPRLMSIVIPTKQSEVF